jgi:hypothetical protein
MKYIKMSALLAMATVVLLAFAGTASADTLTSSGGITPTIKATSTNATLHPGPGTITCESTVEGKVQGHGASSPVSGVITSLTFGPCIGGTVHNATITPGTLSLQVTSTNAGSLSSSGATVTMTMFGVQCGYTTNATTIGTVTGGEHAVFDISASLNRTEGSFFCGTTGNWTGSYKIISPTNIHLHNN